LLARAPSRSEGGGQSAHLTKLGVGTDIERVRACARNFLKEFPVETAVGSATSDGAGDRTA
jgi:hypothetical protein